HVFIDSAPATSATYPLSLHDALPICLQRFPPEKQPAPQPQAAPPAAHPAHAGSHHWLSREPANRQGSEQQGDDYVGDVGNAHERSEEHTSELQSRENLVCRLLLEKKK